MTLGGRTTGTNHSFQGTYALLGGLFFSPQIMLEGGQFIQQGGTNQTQRVMVDLTGSFGLTGGTLSSSNTSVHSFGAASRSLLSSFVQSGGNHTVQNYLTVDGVYRLQGGSLVASNIYVEIDGELHLDGGSASNPGFFTMDNGTCYAQGQNHNLGKLRVLSTGALPRFSDGPWVCTLDLQSAGTVVRFLDSHDVSADWSGTLVIKNWSGSTNGGGTDQVYVGTTAQGLTAAQLGRIVFVNPDAMPGANYPARILSTGEIVPAARPPLSFAPSSGKLVLSWTGNYQLVTAINVNGPYTLVPGASSPYTNSFVDPQRFFRLKSP